MTSSIPSHLPFTPSDGAPVPSLPITHGAVPVPSLKIGTHPPNSSPRHPPKADPQISECLLDPDDVIKRYPKLLNLSCIG